MSSRNERRRRAADRLPPVNRVPVNCADRPMFRVVEIGVSEWHPLPDGKGSPEAVVLHLKVATQDGSEIEMGVRLKTARAVDELIAMLERHRNGVWPGEKEVQ